jgi:RNA polymerase sigma-70 factor, ECF subfamily
MEVLEGVSTAHAVSELCLPRSAARMPAATEVEREVLRLFEEFRSPLLRYGLSFGIPVHDAEEVVQETFLALFQHLRQGRSRENLRGWIFRVTHNLALKQCYAAKTHRDRTEPSEQMLEEPRDPGPTPEQQISESERRRQLLAVVQALPQTDQGCLRLRAEGLTYREISSVLGVSLGTVSMSLARALSRLARADGR